MEDRKMDEQVSEIMRKYLSQATHNYTATIVGKILTIVDAVAGDDTQWKALHDLTSQAIWGLYHELSQEFDFFCDCLAKELGEKKIEPQGIPSQKNSIFKRN